MRSTSFTFTLETRPGVGEGRGGGEGGRRAGRGGAGEGEGRPIKNLIKGVKRLFETVRKSRSLGAHYELKSGELGQDFLLKTCLIYNRIFLGKGKVNKTI